VAGTILKSKPCWHGGGTIRQHEKNIAQYDLPFYVRPDGYRFAQMGTGSVYRLFDNCRNEPMLNLIGLNVSIFAALFLFSYLGYLADKKRGKA
jgi:hypothetical protein